MMREIEIPFGKATRTLALPPENVSWVIGPKDAPPVPDLRQAVVDALRSPIGSPTLAELVVRHGKNTVLLVDDGTRSTPQATILPVLLDELNAAGVEDKDITAIVALGTHRPMTPDECVARYGRETADRIRIENLPQDPDAFVDLGVSPLGVPVAVYRRYLESDLSIAVGNIIPHMYAGWAGGAKMVQPGVSSPKTTAATHLMAGPRVYEILGQAENPVRQEMERIALETGLKFILNVVLNRQGQTVQVVAGHPVAAHRAGVETAKEIYTVDLKERTDIVVASSHPADRDLWQGFKAVNNSGLFAKDGGTLILLIPAPEGIAPDHPEFIKLGTASGATVQRMVAAGQVENGVAAATYLAFDRTRNRLNIILVTEGITNSEAAEIGISATPAFDEALAAAFRLHGNDASIGVVTHGADIMGHFQDCTADLSDAVVSA